MRNWRSITGGAAGSIPANCRHRTASDDDGALKKCMHHNKNRPFETRSIQYIRLSDLMNRRHYSATGNYSIINVHEC